jgi:hypothetical protein
VINKFPTILTHTTPVNDQYIMLPKMIHYQNDIQHCCPGKKEEEKVTFQGTLTPQTISNTYLAFQPYLRHQNGHVGYH